MSSQEIRSILKMLEEGTINAEQAAQLIEAVQKNKASGTDPFSSVGNEQWEGMDEFKRIGKDLSDLGKTIADSVKDRFHDIKKEVAESLMPEDSYEEDLSLYKKIDTEHDFAKVTNVKVNSNNGKVNIRRTHGNNAILGLWTKQDETKNLDDFVTVVNEKNTFSLTVKKEYKEKINIVLQIPDKDYEKVNIDSLNGPVMCEDVKSKMLVIDTSNGSATVKRCTGNTLSLSTTNGSVKSDQNVFEESITLETTNGSAASGMDSAREIKVETTNGSIKMSGSNARSFKTDTVNGSIVMDYLKPYQAEGKFLMNAEAANGSVTINVHRDFGALFECSTSKQGTIRLGRNMNAHVTERSSLGRINYAKGESTFAYKSDIVAAIEAETGNGTISLSFT